MRKRWFVSILLCILVPNSVFTLSISAQNEQSTICGVLAHSLTDEQARLLSANGISWVRSDVSLDPNSNWNSIYQLAKKYNLSLIGTLDPYTLNFNNTSTLSDWQQAVQRTRNEYGDKVSVYEIWNEPNASTDSYCGFYQGTAQQYVDLMKTAYQIIKADNPKAIVLGLGGLPLYSGGIDTLLKQSLSFAQQVVNNGGMNYCDAISLHAYPYGHYSVQAENTFLSSIASYRAITGKDVWITETGQQSDMDAAVQHSPQEQANYLNTSYTLLKSQNVKAYIWYELNDFNPGNSADFQNTSTFGLYDNNLNPKIALETYFGLVIPSPSSSPTQQPTTEPTQTNSQIPDDNQPMDLMPILALSGSVVVAVAVGALVYLRKRRKEKL